MILCRALLMLTLAAFASATFAQFPVPGRGSGMGPGRGMQRAPGERLRTEAFNPGAPTQVQLDRIEDDLKLTEEQRPAWYAYADRVQKLADTMSRARFDARTGAAGGSAVEQLERATSDQRSRVAAVEEITALAQSLYAKLTPEQKAFADRRLALPVLMLVSDTASPRPGERPPSGAADR